MHPTDLAPLQKVFGERKANNHRSRKLKTEQVIPLRCWNPHKALASLVLLNKTGKKCFSQREIYCCRDFSPHRTRVTAKHGEGTVCSQRWESSLPSLRAAGGLRIEVSLGTWGPDPVLIELFATQNRREFPTRKKSSRNRLGSHVPSKTSRRKPPTALKLGGEDSPLSGAYVSQVWCWHVSCEARNHGSVKCYERKERFSLCSQWTEMTPHYRRHGSRVSVRWRENLFSFQISGTIIVGLSFNLRY